MEYSSATYNAQLTQYAFGVAGELTPQDALFLAPEVVVGAAMGQYKAYDVADAFRVYETRRPFGSDGTFIGVSSTDPTFNCTPHALNIGIDNHELELAGEMGAESLRQSKTRTLVSASTTSFAVHVITEANQLAAEGGVGVWGGGANKPIDEIDALIDAIFTATGMMPNRLAFGVGAWRRFKNHPDVIKRYPGAQKTPITLQQANGLFLNPNMEIRVNDGVKATSLPGATEAKSKIVGDDLYIFIAQDGISQYDPSWMKTFRTRTFGVNSVHNWQKPSGRGENLAVDWTEDIKTTGAICAKRITTSG